LEVLVPKSSDSAARLVSPRRQSWSSRIALAVRSAAASVFSRRPNAAALARRRPQMIDSLESRQMLSASLDSSGWTILQPQAGDRIIYVSSSQGKDTNTGLSPSSPVKTLQRGKSLIRSAHGDEMLLKRGDVWHEAIGIWTHSGASAADPNVIGAYGTGARPLIESGNSNGIQTGVLGSVTVNHVAIVGLHFYADGRDHNSPTYISNKPTTGIDWLTAGDGLLIEDTEIEGYGTNINVQGYYGTMHNVQIRRVTDINSWAVGTQSEGVYATNVSGLLIEQSTFDHDGWNASVKGAGQNWTNHNIYLAADALGVTVRDNVISRASGYGLQARGGGTIANNLFMYDPMGMSFGLVNGAKSTPGGVSGSITGNIFEYGIDMGTVAGDGIELGNIKPGANVVVANNLFAHGSSDNRSAIVLTYGAGSTNGNPTVGINDLTIQNNIVDDWHGGIRIDGGLVPGGTGPKAINRVKIINNSFTNVTGSILSVGGALDPKQEVWSGNRYAGWITINGKAQVSSPAGLLPPVFTNPQRDAASYNATQGGSDSLGDFLANEFRQSHANWDANYDAMKVESYISAGFK
jgi:hypothetical protein